MPLLVLRTRSYDNDLEKIWLYHERQSSAASIRMVREIESVVDQLGFHPDLGERDDRYGAACRRILAGQYVVHYERYDDRVEVLRIHHSAQQIDTHRDF